MIFFDLDLRAGLEWSFRQQKFIDGATTAAQNVAQMGNSVRYTGSVTFLANGVDGVLFHSILSLTIVEQGENDFTACMDGYRN